MFYRFGRVKLIMLRRQNSIAVVGEAPARQKPHARCLVSRLCYFATFKGLTEVKVKQLVIAWWNSGKAPT